MSRKLHIVFLLLALLVPPSRVLARLQGMEQVDSAKARLRYAKSDTDKVKILLYMAYKSYMYKPDTGMQYANSALNLSLKANWSIGIGDAFVVMAANYWAKSDYVKALECYQNALDAFSRTGDKRRIAKAYSGMGIANNAQGHFSKSIEYFSKCLGIYRALGDSTKAEGSLDNIGTDYLSLRMYVTALGYFKQALAIASTANNKSAIGQICLNIGDLYFKTTQYDSSLYYLAISKNAYYELQDDRALASTLLSMAEIYRRKGDDKKCFRLYKDIVSIAQRLGDKYNLAIAELTMGEMYVDILSRNKVGATNAEQAKYHGYDDSANIHLARSENMTGQINELLSASDVYLRLSTVREKQGQYKAALRLLQLHRKLQDSIRSGEKGRQFMTADIGYGFRRKEDSIEKVTLVAQAQLSNLKKERELLLLRKKQRVLYEILFLIVIILVGYIIVSASRLQRMRIKSELEKEKIDKQLKETEYVAKMRELSLAALKAQMNPHFIFNCINSIKLYTEQNNAAAASEYLTKFAKLIRMTLDNARADSVSLESELTLLSLYLDLEVMRFKEKLSYEINIAPAVETDYVEIPPLLIQPYVENAVWHGVMPKPGGGKIVIDVSQSQEDNMIQVVITDNGVGRVKSGQLMEASDTTRKSYGTRLTAERISLYNEKHVAAANVEIVDLYNDDVSPAGTRVVINIPIYE